MKGRVCRICRCREVRCLYCGGCGIVLGRRKQKGQGGQFRDINIHKGARVGMRGLLLK